MQVELFNQSGETIGKTDLPDAFFSVPADGNLIHEVLVSQNANSRRVIAHTKGRGEVRGGGKKPWRQKGTGRARHASIRSPIWKGGGVAFGPTKERNFSKKINKKTFRKALAMVLSSKVKDKELFVLDSINFPEPKTKIAASMRSVFIKKPSDSALIITAKKDRNTERAARNLPKTGIISSDCLNVKDIVDRKYVLLAKDAVDLIVNTYKS